MSCRTGGSLLSSEAVDIDAEFSNQFEEGAAVFLRGFGRFGDVALIDEEKALDIGSFELLNHFVLQFLKGLRDGIGQGDVDISKDRMVGEGDGAPDDAFEFANVAGPVVAAHL